MNTYDACDVLCAQAFGSPLDATDWYMLRKYPRQADVTRAVRAARSNGLAIEAIEVARDGRIRVGRTRSIFGDQVAEDEFARWDREGRL